MLLETGLQSFLSAVPEKVIALVLYDTQRVRSLSEYLKTQYRNQVAPLNLASPSVVPSAVAFSGVPAASGFDAELALKD